MTIEIDNVWMYQLIRYEGKIQLCELYSLGNEVFFIPTYWSLTNTRRIIKDLLYQRKVLQIIPDGDFINEMVQERLIHG